MLCVAQMGWLHAVPKDPEKSKSKAAKRLSRLERLKGAGTVPHLPPVVYGTAELEHFMQVGPAQYNGMGTSPLSFTELASYAALCGVDFQPWQARLLHELSKHYVHHTVLGEDPQAPAPYIDVRQVKRDAVSKRLAAAMGAFLKKGTKK